MTTPPTFGPEFRAILLELFRWRRDVRQFRRVPLPPDALDRLIATACLAPSVGLSQPWRFVTVDDPARRLAIRANFHRCNAAALAAQADDRQARYAALKLAGLDDAPCHLAVFADPSTRQGHGLGRHTMPEMIEYSVALAIHTLWLAARAEGLGVGWVSILNPAEVATALEVPIGWKLVGYLCIGVPEGEEVQPALERQGWEERRGGAEVIVRR